MPTHYSIRLVSTKVGCYSTVPGVNGFFPVAKALSDLNCPLYEAEVHERVSHAVCCESKPRYYKQLCTHNFGVFWSYQKSRIQNCVRNKPDTD